MNIFVMGKYQMRNIFLLTLVASKLSTWNFLLFTNDTIRHCWGADTDQTPSDSFSFLFQLCKAINLKLLKGNRDYECVSYTYVYIIYVKSYKQYICYRLGAWYCLLLILVIWFAACLSCHGLAWYCSKSCVGGRQKIYMLCFLPSSKFVH